MVVDNDKEVEEEVILDVEIGEGKCSIDVRVKDSVVEEYIYGEEVFGSDEFFVEVKND